MSYQLQFTKQASKDAKKIAQSNLKQKAQTLLRLVAQDPLQTPPPVEKLEGDLSGAYSRRINLQHRLVYQIRTAQQTVRILRMWTHYGHN